jgi:death-on-curing protein
VSDGLIFLRKQEVIDIHAQLIIAFGGSKGLRDEGALESALAAPEQRAYYEGADLAICAATYAYHLTQAHAFVDGNKRVAAAVTEIFVELNGATLQATDEEIVQLFLSIAAKTASRADIERIFRQWIIIEQP